jgi:hypothetical protein
MQSLFWQSHHLNKSLRTLFLAKGKRRTLSSFVSVAISSFLNTGTHTPANYAGSE